MQLRFKVSISGTEFSAHPGDVLEVDGMLSKDEIARLIDSGVCEPVKKQVETATTRKHPKNAKTD